jgi:NAD(P)-dependent dehydrogenase (short-subunit alcohol dehydrogenase family)
VINALVVGGTGGLGGAIASELARRGCSVGLIARDVGRISRMVESLGEPSWGFAVDVLDPLGLSKAITAAEVRFGGIDAVIFAAGRFRAIGPIELVAPEEWRLDLETSLLGASNAIRAALPALRRSKMASISVLVGPGHHKGDRHASASTSAQAGLVRLVECLDLELRAVPIPIYAVFPGLTPVGRTVHLVESTAGRIFLPEYTEALGEGKEVGPEVAAEMVAWLATRRPKELSGRVVFALSTPELLEARLEAVAKEDRGRLRVV